MYTENSKNLTVMEIRIKWLRDLKGITQQEVAKALGVSQGLVNSWENGYLNISLKKLVKLSYFYGVPIDYIFGLVTDYNKDIYTFKSELDLKYLGKKVRLVRKMAGLTQDEFAKAIHKERSCLSYYECGKMAMSSADLKEICNDFGFSADWCVGNTTKCIRRDKKVRINDEEIKEYIEI